MTSEEGKPLRFYDLFPRERLVLLVCGLAFLSWKGWTVYAKTETPEVTLSEADVRVRLDLNAATAHELEELPMIGPGRAASIVERRATHGPFSSVDGLKQVRDISDKVVEAIRPFVLAGPGNNTR